MLITFLRLLFHFKMPSQMFDTISLKLHQECRSLRTILSSTSAYIAQHAVLSTLNWSQLVLVNDIHLKEMRPLIGNLPIRYRHLYTAVNAVLPNPP